MNVRHLEEGDYQPINRVIDSWFSGRPLANLLPGIFFIDFRPTSFAVQEDNEVIGFLAGFVSQTDPSQRIHPFCRHPSRSSQAWFGAPALLNIFRDSSATWLHDGSLYYFGGEQRIDRVSHANGLSRRTQQWGTARRAVHD